MAEDYNVADVPVNVRAAAIAYAAARTPAELILTPAEKALVAACFEVAMAHSPMVAGAESYDFECVMRDLFARLDVPFPNKTDLTNGPMLAAMHRVRDEDWTVQ